MEISIVDEKETVKGLISASTLEPSMLKHKILHALDRARETVGKVRWEEIGKVDAESLGEEYFVRIRL